MSSTLTGPPNLPPLSPVPAPRGGRRLLGLLFILFALPFGLAAALYFGHWRPASAGNYGEILTAPRLDPAQLQLADRAPPAAALTGRWTLLVAAAGDCTATCRAELDLTQRLHLALNKNMPRLRRLLLTPEPTSTAAALQASWPDLLIASSSDAGWRALLSGVPQGTTRVYLLDPESRPVLRFPLDVDGRRALRDIEQLLRLSWIG